MNSLENLDFHHVLNVGTQFLNQEIKKLAKPEFAANPDKFYPTETLRKLGFSRAQCPKCQNHFWRHTEKREVCANMMFFQSHQACSAHLLFLF
jgi:hypothetical protein